MEILRIGIYLFFLIFVCFNQLVLCASPPRTTGPPPRTTGPPTTTRPRTTVTPTTPRVVH